ncbi:Hypothetical protein PP7435_CHR3-0778 [Komagataella phaffii CBS 7435]|uniref:Uncharacterized protein n=1 Tax=Komagataella phaffii (strain ATCC 76273 / CBS 7435 / CECT 11047 / NRRL Y-11430 / Wegner 21-1) TaxID=981350 RepID=F2QWF4_KOMPC|nr:Hypothetical protein BQ9382_C3-4082 [Komagataella phaffii CBS 7435]CCA39732.1 Hypothetical protein PP7435_CHR3-0778 [Komagataella phaffii CBS 7435]
MPLQKPVRNSLSDRVPKFTGGYMEVASGGMSQKGAYGADGVKFVPRGIGSSCFKGLMWGANNVGIKSSPSLMMR